MFLSINLTTSTFLETIPNRIMLSLTYKYSQCVALPMGTILRTKSVILMTWHSFTIEHEILICYRRKVSKREVMSTKLESLSYKFANIYPDFQQISKVGTDSIPFYISCSNQKLEKSSIDYYILSHIIFVFPLLS